MLKWFLFQLKSTQSPWPRFLRRSPRDNERDILSVSQGALMWAKALYLKACTSSISNLLITAPSWDGDPADCPLRGSLFSHTFPVGPDMVTFNYHESPTRKAPLPLYHMHIIRMCQLFCVMDEDCALKQPVPPVSPREPIAMRYNHDDITREVGQMHGHWKTERQSVFLLQWFDVVMLKTHSERKKRKESTPTQMKTLLKRRSHAPLSRLSGLQPVIPKALLASSTSRHRTRKRMLKTDIASALA